MKAQAWGWLVAGVLAAGMNAWYHDGGFALAHRAVDRVQHGTDAVLALASERTEEFLNQARMLTADETPRCRLASDWSRFAVTSALQRAQLDRLAAERGRFEAEMRAQADRMQVAAFAMRPMTIHTPQCRTVVVRVPRMPRVEIPAVPTVMESFSREPL